MKSEKIKREFLEQAAFLRRLAVRVSEYDKNGKYQVSMHWLMKQLEEAAQEAEQEAAAMED